MKYIPRVFPYLKPHWKLAAFSVLLIALGSLIGLLIPWPIKILVDSAIGKLPVHGFLAILLGPIAGNAVALLLFAVIAGLVLTIMQNGMSLLDNYLNTRLVQNIQLY